MSWSSRTAIRPCSREEGREVTDDDGLDGLQRGDRARPRTAVDGRHVAQEGAGAAYRQNDFGAARRVGRHLHPPRGQHDHPVVGVALGHDGLAAIPFPGSAGGPEVGDLLGGEEGQELPWLR